MSNNVLIGIGGGTGSGKTSFAKNLLTEFDEGEMIILEQDAYYKDLAHVSFEERTERNFDHPDAIDFDLLKEHLQSLLHDQSIEMPIYDFSTHTRQPETRTVDVHRAILLEGIMVLTDEELRNMMTIKIYVETDSDVRFLRRLQRDIKERGRTVDDVIQQYESTVRPMHEQFVEITKKYADIILPEGGENAVAVDLIQTKIQSLLKGKSLNN
ncbi:MAG: uridine kinase [Candidatus Marinimicrobia bacterium]|nr:uridine kinase [Candidatus Neomarinimicrobiota bacterium]|tara:strand:+ start:2717 stop:3352 length:636 start_codon:yes stop_codon:yes gene_type:complete